MNSETSNKIVVIGAGNVGETICYTLMLRAQVGEIVLIDVNEKKAKDGKKEPSADDRILEERLAESIGAPVHVVYGKKGRGKIVIDFADLDDLDALIAKLAPEKM